MARSTDRVKGITISIGGDTTGLSKALSGVNKNISETQKQLNDVNKLLKLDPKNTVLLAQKQKLLAKAVDDTSQKLSVLEKAQKEVQESLKVGDISEKQYQAYQREIEETRIKLENLNKETENNNAALQKSPGILSKAKSGLQGIAVAAKTVSVGFAATAAAAVALVEGTKEARTDMAKLETNAMAAGVGLDTVQNAMKELTAVSDGTDASVEALSNLLAAGFDDQSMTDAVEALSGAVIKFPDTMKIESLADSLQETLATKEATGQFAELLGRLGINVEDYNKKISKMSEESARSYSVSLLQQAGLKDLNDQFRENNSELVDYQESQYDFNQAMNEMAEAVEPVVSVGLKALAEILGKITEIVQPLGEVFLPLLSGAFEAIGVALDAISPVLEFVFNLLKGISDVIGGAFGWIGDTIGSIFGGGRSIDVQANYVNDLPQYASGTKSARRGWALVGENGPELMLMRGGETIIPNNRLAYAGAGGDVYNITIDAKNVREFNDVVKIAQNARQYKRARG